MVKLFLCKTKYQQLEMNEVITLLKKVSVIIPVRNEERTVSNCIDSLLNNSYKNIEIIVVDGMSNDRTVEVIKGYIDKYGEKIKLLQNSSVFTPTGLNLGISNSTGDYIMIASGHARYSENYIDECVNAIENGECDVAGGVMVVIPRSDSPKAIAISEVLKHPFGVGGAKYRTGAREKMYVDTVAYGVYKKEIFEKIGLFKEELIRNQDIEFNLRLKKAGYRTMLIPQARSYYYARDTYKKLWENNFSNGFWVTYSAKFVRRAFRLRHLIPLFFVLYLFLFASVCFFQFSYLTILISVPLILYVILSICYSLSISLKIGKFSLFFHLIIAFLTLHISYGMGSIFGVLRLILR